MKRNGLLYSVLGVIILAFIIQVAFIISGYNSIESDVLVISEINNIRGSIQRYSKLVLIEFIDYQLESEIDYNLNSNIIVDDAFKNNNKDDALNNLKNSWESMKLIAREYVKEQDIEKKQNLRIDFLSQSENSWITTDGIILKSQSISSNKFYYLHTLAFSLVMSFLAIVLVLIVYRRTVVKNLEKESIYDPLTHAYNRRNLDDILEKEILKAERGNKAFSLIMFDIDFFKNVNDTYGHGVGDQVLKDITRVVNDLIRKYDSLARFGGEEFIVVLPNTEGENALILAERLRLAIQEHSFDTICTITSSFGVTQYRVGEKPCDILKRVDLALYEAKETGRNKCILKY